MTGEPEEALPSGGPTTVTRVGATVRRPVRSWSAAVHWLLDRLAEAGVAGVPRFLGIDDNGREILDHLDGEVGHHPLPEQVRSDSALVSAARLLRTLHDATAGRPDVRSHDWMFPPVEPVEVVCHGDFAPYNCVFVDGETVGVFDFDAAHPGPRHWDIAYALYRFAPLTSPANEEGFGDVTEQARRARLFLDTYGCTRAERAAAMAAVAPRLQALVDFMRTAAAAGDETFARHIAEGHADLYLADIDHAQRSTQAWTASVVGNMPA